MAKMENYHALLIGINQYQDDQFAELRWAKNDCEKIFEVLTGKNGCFPKKNVVKLIDEEATTRNIQKNLFSKALNDRTENDTVLVYFSGHAFQSSFQNKVFLSSHDTIKQNIIENPFEGIPLSRLYDEIFGPTLAQSIILILDTCYSGAIAPQSFRGDTPQTPLLDSKYSGFRGRVAIVSSPHNVQSREDDNLEHGVLTYWLLKGLNNEAMNQSGIVTLDGLMAYVKQYSTKEQPFGWIGFDYGETPLAHYPSPEHAKIVSKTFATPEISSDAPIIYHKLENPLEPYSDCAADLAGVIKEQKHNHLEPQKLAMEALRLAAEAELVILLRNTDQQWTVKSQSDIGTAGLNASKYMDEIIPEILKAIIQSEVLEPDFAGIYLSSISHSQGNSSFLITPVKNDESSEVVVLCGSELPLIQNDLYSHFIIGFYKATNEFSFSTGYDHELIEGLILDHIKKFHKFVPITMYKHREELFVSRLKEMAMRYQPILKLSETEPHVSGYEALAYDTEKKESPQDLFRTAELWGPRFTLALDLYFLETSITNYREILKNTPGMRRPEDILDLSINVYPESLLRTRYFKELEAMIQAEVLPSEKLFVEISEKQRFPTVHPNDGIAKGTDITTFREILEKYVDALGIGFAIDDFGVGFSSIERLSNLHPGYLKIDREILLLETAKDTVEFIIRFMNHLTSRKFLRRSKIVVEGFDKIANRNVSMHNLYNVGVQFIQGYIIGEPRLGELDRIDKQGRDYLISLIKGVHDD
jgi:EAL domain-containing protein (putative c-di-GMP-specific phosphodiesterase class I)